jgi:predicted nucleic acid-binding protein
MDRLILLDSGPLGLVTNPRESDDGRRCKAWLRAELAAGSMVRVPELADYEVRRELLRAGRSKGLARLDELAERVGFLPVTSDVWKLAAQLWAEARSAGWPTADAAALDGDVILAAQAGLAMEPGTTVIVATTNAGHLGRFVDARRWEDLAEALG